MNIIYNIIISIYQLLITINALFDSKSKDWIIGRKNLWSSLELKTKNIKDTPAAHKYCRFDFSSILFGFTTEKALGNLISD